MNCPNCGKENYRNVKFCCYCGQSMGITDKETIESRSQNKITGVSEKKHGTHKWYTVLLLLIVLLSAAFLIPRLSEKQTEPIISASTDRITRPVQQKNKGMGYTENVVKVVDGAYEKDAAIVDDAAKEHSVKISQNSLILPESDSRFYSAEELQTLNANQLRLARNEIYARHGRKFTSEELQSYFSALSWYTPVYEAEEFDAKGDSVFNKFELANRELIIELEQTERPEEPNGNHLLGKYYYYRFYVDDDVVEEYTPETAHEWITVIENIETQDGLLVKWENEARKDRDYQKIDEDSYVHRFYDPEGNEYECPMYFNEDGTVSVFSYDGLEWSMYKKQ